MEGVEGFVAETERLVLRRLTMDDLDAMAELFADSEVMRFSVRGVQNADQTRAWIDRQLDHYETDGIGAWAIVRAWPREE